MANTILEKLQEKYPNAEGINDARNIAEAMACISGTGGRGANAIADHTWAMHSVIYMPNGGTGDMFAEEYAVVTAVDLSLPASWIAPEGKGFAGFGETSDAASPIDSPYYLTANSRLYAIWVDIFTIAFDANGGTGTIESVTCLDGSSVELPDGTDLTAPEGKQFVGWGDTALATEAIESPYTPEADGRLYAIWEDIPEEPAEPAEA